MLGYLDIKPYLTWLKIIKNYKCHWAGSEPTTREFRLVS